MRACPAARPTPNPDDIVTSHDIAVELSAARESTVGATTVRRALPQRHRRTVGPWCFEDHMGPTNVTPTAGLDVGPHPHIGLQTVTWLTEGEVLHKDSLGSEQLIKPGQVNLMTAGTGVVHSEEATGSYSGRLQGVQLWVAQPEDTRSTAPAFEHHGSLPHLEFDSSIATLITGSVDAVTAPSRQDWPAVGIQGELRKGRTVWPLDPDFEHGLIVIEGAVAIGRTVVRPGQFAYLAPGFDELPIDANDAATILLIGGQPFAEDIIIWWNLVARTTDEIDTAYLGWRDGQFGHVDTTLAPMPTPTPPWFTGRTPAP